MRVVGDERFGAGGDVSIDKLIVIRVGRDKAPVEPRLDTLNVRKREKSLNNVPRDLGRGPLLNYLLVLQQYRRGGDECESAVEEKIEEPPESAPTPDRGEQNIRV